MFFNLDGGCDETSPLPFVSVREHERKTTKTTSLTLARMDKTLGTQEIFAEK